MAELNYSKKRLTPIITKFGIDVEKDVVFQSIITLFDGQTDYQMWALKLVFGHVTTLEDLQNIKHWADENHTFISLLSKHNLVSYKSASDIVTLHREMDSLAAVQTVKKVIAMFNTEQRNMLKGAFLDILDSPLNACSNRRFNDFFMLAKEFITLPSHRQQKFIILMSAVTDVSSIMEYMKKAIETTYDWNREDMLSYAQRACPDTEVCYDDHGVVILSVPSFNSSQKLCGNGRTAWCLTRENSYFNRYTKENNNAQQFFFFDFNLRENHELAHVGFSVNPERGINYAHSTRNNNMMSLIEVDGSRWNIHKLLKHHNIAKSVYIRLKKLTNYKWSLESFLMNITRFGIKVLTLEDGRIAIPIISNDIKQFVLGHTLINELNVRYDTSKVFAVLDFAKEINDDHAIQVYVFNKDKYETMSYAFMVDPYGVKNNNPATLGENNLALDIFVESVEINPSILLHKLIDEANIAAAIKLLKENKDVDPNLEFYNSIPVIKALTKPSVELFNAIVQHPKFDLNMKEGFGEPLVNFLLLYAESTIDESKKGSSKPFLDMIMNLLNNPNYDLNAKNMNEDTALHNACESTFAIPVVEFLINNKNVDINIENEWGYKPIDVAIENNNIGAIKLLLTREDLKIDAQTKELLDETKLDLKSIKAAVKTNSKNEEKDNDYAEVFSKMFS